LKGIRPLTKAVPVGWICDYETLVVEIDAIFKYSDLSLKAGVIRQHGMVPTFSRSVWTQR
jgi:hypothetical protein